MGSFENAKRFFEACEAPAGWSGCREYVAAGAAFAAQSEPLTDIHTVEAYCDWLAAFGTTTAPGASYDLHASSFDEEKNVAMFFATYTAKHTGPGGPVPPTQQETDSHYVYVLTMNDEAKVENMVKIWNAPWAMRELGWM